MYFTDQMPPDMTSLFGAGGYPLPKPMGAVSAQPSFNFGGSPMGGAGPSQFGNYPMARNIIGAGTVGGGAGGMTWNYGTGWGYGTQASAQKKLPYMNEHGIDIRTGQSLDEMQQRINRLSQQRDYQQQMANQRLGRPPVPYQRRQPYYNR